MRRWYLLLGTLILFAAALLTGLVTGQDTGERLFEVYAQIGSPPPQGVRYNRPLDQYAMVNLVGELVLVDAKTYAQQHTLYPAGADIVAYAFSHNGKLLAVALENRIEIWDTLTGQMVADIEPDGALAVQRPLYWSDDDDLLAFEAVIRAPQAIRRSENDTSILPWVWDVASGRRIRGSRLPDRASAQPFYDNRGGVVLGQNDTLITAIAERLQIMHFDQNSFNVTADVRTGRAELDPLSIWRSLADESLYIRRDNDREVVQVNTETGLFVELQVGRSLTLARLDALDGIVLGNTAHIIGEPFSRQSTSLVEFLLGQNYLADYDYHPLTITLIDILQPMTLPGDQFALLVHVYDEATGTGQIQFVQPEIQQLALSPDEQQLLVRRSDGDQRLELYDLYTGAFVRSYLPNTRGLGLGHILDFDATGSIIVTDFQRIDVNTGVTLNQDLSYINSFDSMYFNDESTQLVTITGRTWRSWDIETQQLLRETPLDLRGTVIRTWRNGQRFLSITDDGNGIEIYNVVTDERRHLFFESLKGRSIIDILPSADWTHYFVIYSEASYDAYSPGNAVAMYGLESGKLWVIADEDLPPVYSRQYGWIDDRTVYIYSDPEYDGQPRRVYGVEYHASGLPACMVEAFPDSYTRWLDAWERFTYYLRVDTLNRLAQAVCTVLANDGGADGIDGLFAPTPLPTEFHPSPTPALVAGVPACLTLSFPYQALDYAEDWRRITEGLNDDQIKELETLLCENLTGSGYEPEGFPAPPPIVMTIDVATGVRSQGTYIPVVPRTGRSSLPIFDAFRRVERRDLTNPVMSPDGQFVAEFISGSNIRIWRVTRPYEDFIDEVTATAQAQITAQNLIRVLPTSTPPFNQVGTARPTFTPTMSVTPPPRPSEYLEQDQRDVVETVNGGDTLYTVDNPPPDWNPDGRMIVPPLRDYSFGVYIVQPTSTATRPTSVPPTFTPLPPDLPTNTPSRTPRPESLLPTATPTLSVDRMRTVPQQYSNAMWWLSPVDGSLTIDETLPRCGLDYECTFSFNREWVWYSDDFGVYVSRPDGRDKQMLADFSTNPTDLQFDYTWTGAETLRYSVALIERDPDYPNTYTQYLYPGNPNPTPIPTVIYPYFDINEIGVEVLSYQPGEGRIAVARTSYNTGSGTAYKYYIYDYATGQADFFSRGGTDIEFIWHPNGDRLFYRYPGGSPNNPWYVYTVATAEHRILGSVLPDGLWSPDGRYRVSWYYPPDEELRVLLETEQPIPKLSIWDSETGLTRLYYIPETEEDRLDARLLWSPDSRYLTFRYQLPGDSGEAARPRLLVLDTVTGYVMDLGFETDMPVAWVGD